MAFPVVEATSTWGGTSSAALTHGPITLPTGIESDDLLLCLFSVDGTPTCTPSAGWTLLGAGNYSTTVTGAVCWRRASGVADEDALTVSTSAYSLAATAIVFRLSHANDPLGAWAAGSSATPDPPAVTLTSSQDALWLALHASDAMVTASAAPAGYGGLLARIAVNAGGASSSAAYRTAAGQVENPAGFTASTEQWVAWTVGLTFRPVTGRIAQPLFHVVTRALVVGTARIDAPGPLGAPSIRARHLAASAGWIEINGPLGAPAIYGQQRAVSALPAVPVAVADARRRLLSDPLPMRRSTALPAYRDDVVLPWVYGRATLAPVPLDAAGLEWLVADHPIVGVMAVRDGATALDGWSLSQQLDATGTPVALLRLTRSVEKTLSVDVAGRRHPATGALLEHPADIAEDLLTACGWSVPLGAFDAVRDAFPGVALGGCLADIPTLREAVSVVLGSVDADWSASPLRAWLPEPSETPIATLGAKDCVSAEAVTDHRDLATRLRVAYAYDWAAGAPRGSLVVEAVDRLAELGDITQDLDLPWVRTARDALALATRALGRRARARWDVSLALPRRDNYAPGDVVHLAHPWIPAGPAVVSEVSRTATSQSLAVHRYAGDAPRVELTTRGQLVDAAGAEPVSVSYKDGVATFTILNDLGAPLAGASATLDGAETRTTDKLGQVQFRTERGAHLLLVVALGYAPLEVEVIV